MDLYLLTKALHIVAMVAWFAGLFYLPRIFVYAVEREDAGSLATLQVMATKLYKLIMTPAMIATWLFGLLLIWQNPAWLEGQGWLHAKLLLVVLLSAYQGSLGRFVRQLNRGGLTRSGRFFRLYNEVPTLLLVGIVLLASLKPF